MRRITLLACSLPFFFGALEGSAPGRCSAQGSLVARQVAAPAADILSGLLRLPDPSAGAVRSRAALLPVSWTEDGSGAWVYSAQVPLGSGPLGLALVAPGADGWDVRLQGLGLDMDLAEAAQAGAAVERRTQWLEEELAGWSVQRFDLAHLPAGTWTVSLRAPQAGAGLAPSPGFLVARDRQPLTAAAHVSTHARLADRRIGISAQVELETDLLETGRTAPVPLAGAVLHAVARVTSGTYSGSIELHDDGLHGDGDALDGRFGAALPAGLSGPVQARIELTGSWDGDRFLRTTALSFDVAEPLLELTGKVTTHVEDAGRMRFDLEALPLAKARRVQVSAEVWGRSASGHPVPIAWLSRMQDPVQGGATWRLPLWLDAGWFAVAEAQPPLELRAVRIQDPGHHGVLAAAERIPVPAGALPPLAGRGAGRISVATLTSFSSASPVGPLAPSGAALIQPGLMLSHGYCSSGGVWPSADFSQPKLNFLDGSQNRTHDEFAQLLAQQGAGFTSFGVVAHSQGGPAALHLLTYYQSPLDQAQGPRRIQSVGSPYQGTPLASLGFFACGVNNDMTPGGASTWLAGIPSAARAEVYYWTTANDGSACNFFTDLLLTNPEDGTTERSRGQLPGGNNMGHTTGWCHTTGMSDPAQYTDSSRNAQMDAEAAR